MSVNNGGDDGIRGASVIGFALDNSRVTNNGNAVNESGLDFVGGLTGTASIQLVTVFGSFENGMIVTNASGSLNLTVTGSTLNAVSTANSGNDGLHLDANNTANITVSVTGSTFSDNRGDHFQFSTNATSSGTNSVTFSNNTLVGDRGSTHGGTDLGAGITISPDAAADTTFTIAEQQHPGRRLPTPSRSPPAPPPCPAGVTVGHDQRQHDRHRRHHGLGIGAGRRDRGVRRRRRRPHDPDREQPDPAVVGLRRHRHAHPRRLADAERHDHRQHGRQPGDVRRERHPRHRRGDHHRRGHDLRRDHRQHARRLRAAAARPISACASASCTTFRLPGYAGAAGDTAAVVSFVQGNNPGAETGSATANFPAGGGGFVGGAACPTPP